MVKAARYLSLCGLGRKEVSSFIAPTFQGYSFNWAGLNCAGRWKKGAVAWETGTDKPADSSWEGAAFLRQTSAPGREIKDPGWGNSRSGRPNGKMKW